eukprot:759953-Hanusia_phi.AAC.1
MSLGKARSTRSLDARSQSPPALTPYFHRSRRRGARTCARGKERRQELKASITSSDHFASPSLEAPCPSSDRRPTFASLRLSETTTTTEEPDLRVLNFHGPSCIIHGA